MNPIIRNILAVVAGIAVGSMVNMGILGLSESMVPPPDGVDSTDLESIKANIHLYEIKHFIVPFLAHALGTLVGALVACWIGVSNFKRLAMVIGVWFLLGGMVMAYLIPHWFAALDLLLAYIPMAWLGWSLAGRNKGRYT